MATAVGLNMKMTADTSGLGRGMTRAEKLLQGIDKNARSSARSLRAIATIQIGGALLKGLSSVSSAIMGYVADVRQAAGAIQNFAQISNSSVAEFQRFAAAAGTVGIENEKLADIFKDVNDRIGDFLQTGGGPMADFFENVAPRVGVTVDQFRKLSGPQALQLYVKTLQDANLSQQEFTFYLEAMASDTTALIPLLKNGGEAFLEIANRAERLGIVLSEDQVGAIREMNGALTLVQKTFEGIIGQVTANLAPIVTAITEEFLQFVEAFEGVNGAQGGNAIAQLITKTISNGLESFLNVLKALGNGLVTLLDALGRVSARIAELFGFDLRSDRQRQLEQERSVVNRDLTNVQRGVAQAQAQGRDTTAAQEAIDTLRARLEDLNKQIAQETGEGLAELLRAGLNQGIDAAIAANQRVADKLADNAAAAEPVVQADVAAVEAAVAFNEKAWEAGLNEFERKFFGLDKPDVAAAVNPAIQRIADAIEASEKQRSDRASEIENSRLDNLARASTQALQVNDIRSGGLSEVLRIASGREDPAIDEYRKQLAELRKIEQRIGDLRADKVKIIGGAGRAA